MILEYNLCLWDFYIFHYPMIFFPGQTQWIVYFSDFFFFPAENIQLFKNVQKLLHKNCPELSSAQKVPSWKCQECPHLKLPQHNFNIRRREEESQCTWALLPVYWNLRVSTVKFDLLRVLNLYILLYTGVSYTKNFNHWNSSK